MEEKIGIKESIVSEKIQLGTMELTPELKEDAKKAVIDRWESVKANRKEAIDKYDIYESLYTAGQYSSGKAKQTVANVMTTNAFNAIEDWVALVMDYLFPVDPPFQVKARNTYMSDEKLDLIAKVLNGNMKDTNFMMEFEKVARQGFKLGTFVAKASYELEEKDAVRVVSEDKYLDGKAIKDDGETMKETKVEEYIDIDDHPIYKPVDLRRLAFRPDKLNWIIEFIDDDWSNVEIGATKGIYSNLEKAKKTSYPGDNDGTDKELMNMHDIELKDNSIRTIDTDVELMEAHNIPLDIEVDGKKIKVLCLITLANRTEVIRVQPYPYKKLAYLFNQFFEKPGVEGMGLIEILEKMLNETNTRRKQALDANTMGLYGMKAVNMKYIKHPSQLKIRKDGLIELKATDKPIDQIVSFFRPPTEYSNIAMNLVDKIALDIINTTRLKGVLSGEKVTPNPTATEWAGMLKEALKSVKMIIKRISHYQIEAWLERAYIMNIFNRQKSWKLPINMKMPEEISGKENDVQNTFIEISPDQVYSEGIKIEAIGVAYMEDQVVNRHQQLQLLDTLVKYSQLPLINPMGQMVEPNFYKLMRDVIIKFGNEDPDSFFLPKPPPPPMLPPNMPPQGGLPPVKVNKNPPRESDILGQSVNPGGVA